MKYRKKPVTIEAVQWNIKNRIKCFEFLGRKNVDKEIIYIDTDNFIFSFGKLTIKTLEGNMAVSEGDYIIKGVNGEYYPCKPDIFKKTYEKVV